MDKPIKIGNGILEQIEHSYYVTGTITKKGVFNFQMDLMEDFYRKYSYAAKWDYEKFIREILDYYE